MSQFTTAYGKDVATYIDPKTAHVRIKFVQGGELPVELQGIFTSVRVADQMIVNYIEKDKPVSKVKKVKEDIKES